MTAQIERLLELDKAASQGPWLHGSWNVITTSPIGIQEGSKTVAECANPLKPGHEVSANGEFITLSRTLAPKLARALKVAKEAIESAPHDDLCELFDPFEYNDLKCTCWKQEALTQIEKEIA